MCPRQPVPLHVEDLTGLNKFCISNADVCTKKTPCSKFLLVQGGEQAVPGCVPPAAGPTPRGGPTAANSCWFRLVKKLCLAVCPWQPVRYASTWRTPCSKLLLVQGGEQAVPGCVPPAAGPPPCGGPPAANSCWFRVVNKLCLAVCPRQPVPLHVEDLTGLNKFCISNADVCTKKTPCSKFLLVQGGEQAVPGCVPPAAGPTPRGGPHRAQQLQPGAPGRLQGGFAHLYHDNIASDPHLFEVRGRLTVNFTASDSQFSVWQSVP